MSKYLKYIFIIIGIALVLFGVYSYFIKRDNSSEKNMENEKDNIKYSNFGFLKSKDVNSKKRLIFPILKGMNENNIDDFYVLYSNEDDTINLVGITEKMDYVEYDYEKYIKNEVSKLKTKDNFEKKEIETNNDLISAIRVSYTALDNNKKVVKYEKLFITTQLADKEIATLIYTYTNGSLDDDINTIIENLSIRNDATYIIGTVKGDKLDITLNQHGKGIKYNINFSLDSNKYEEVINGENKINRTTLKNKNSNKEIDLFTIYNDGKIESSGYDTVNYWLGKYYLLLELNYEEKMINNIKFKKFENEDYKVYVYNESNECFVVLVFHNEDNIDDFSNFSVKTEK